MKRRLSSLPLVKKLVIAFLVGGLVPMLILGLVSLNNANDTIRTQVSNQLLAVRDQKSHEIARYFDVIRKQATVLASEPAIVAAALQLPDAFRDYARETELDPQEIAKLREELNHYYNQQFGTEFARLNNGIKPDMRTPLQQLDDASVVMQHSYISANPNPLGSKHLLDAAAIDTRYNRMHARLHELLRPYVEKFGYYDAFIADASSGLLVYSVFKELDFATSLKNGPYADSNLGAAFRKGLTLQQNASVMVDFDHYRPSYDAPASFVAAPIVSNGKTIALLILQIPINHINTIMTDRSGMGETGESYLVGPNQLMRSDSFLSPQFHTVIASFRNPDKGKVDTEATRRALAGESGVDTIIDYNGNPVVSAYSTVDLGDFRWAVLAEQDVAEAFAPERSLLLSTLLTAGLCTAALIGLGLYLSRLIAHPINQVAAVLKTVSTRGDFTVRAKTSSTDEVGQMAQAFNDFLQTLGESFRQINEVLTAVSDGNTRVRVNDAYMGDIAALAQGVNSAIAKINDFQDQQKLAAAKLQQSALALEEKVNESAEMARLANVEAERANRIKQALDVASTSVMMTDAQNNITYTNAALDSMMREYEADIRKALPQFRANALMGANMDQFHRNPQHQRNIIGNLHGTHEAQISVGDRTFRLTANPILQDNRRVGTVVEWKDRTAELRIEAEIDRIVEQASAGDFNTHLNLDGRTGFFLSLSRGLNRMIDVTRNALTDVTKIMERVAQGDLTQKVEKGYTGLFGQLKDDVNSTIARLEEVIGNIMESANTISSGAAEVAVGMNDLSSRTEQQAASLEETASSMDQMTSAVKASNEHAQNATRYAQEAERAAVQGGEVVQQAIDSMQSINAASRRIADIIGVIDGIAFQTNLLALNAAVEAARAGEQGRGFAVVAAEVRNLAQRSGNAAREIKTLIKDSLEKVDNGSRLVNQSGDTLTSIVKAVEEVAVFVKTIANASQEQTSGITQVNTAVAQMDQMTQQNSALVEEVTAAGVTMADQAQKMSAELSFFNVRKNSGAAH